MCVCVCVRACVRVSGKYQLGVDRPDPKTWKANFRCAVNSLPDMEEVKDKSIKKGTNAFRVYKMLSSSERSTKKGGQGHRASQPPPHQEVCCILQRDLLVSELRVSLTK